MLVDWFTVIAQIFNFLVLAGLLKHFLYQPILKAIDDRETKILAQITEAEQQKTETQQEKELYQKKNQTFDDMKQEHLTQALEEIKLEQQKLREEAQQEVETFRVIQNQQIKTEYLKLKQSIQENIQKEVLGMTQKALKDLANSKLETQIIDVFLERQSREKNFKKQLNLSNQAQPLMVQINSSFKLSPLQRTAITESIQQNITRESELVFNEKHPTLLCGIELIFNGQKMSWNIKDYLGDLEKNLASLVNE